MNELERAFAKALRGPEGQPDLFRQLRDAELAFLMPYHPEMEGMVEVGNGSTMTFCVWENPNGRFVPVFTSAERAEQALEATGMGDKPFVVGEMKGEWLFAALAGQEEKVVLNPACGMGEILLDHNAVAKIADGSILKPIDDESESVSGAVKLVDPADYPTDFLQPLFQFLRTRPEVKAAWLFQQTDGPKERTVYVFGLWATGDTETARQDFSVVAKAAHPAETDFGVFIMDPAEPQMAEMMRRHQPFFAAPGFTPP